MNQFTVGGVPEHFNGPWKYAIENNLFAERGIQVNFIEYPDGTGAMCRDLENKQLDLAVVLMEGIVAHIVNKGGASIIAPYVTTPLTWGIYVNANSQIKNVSDLKNSTIAISRFGSGSHIMSVLLANDQGWDAQQDINFSVVGSIDNLGTAIQSNKADAFLWEVFTTKPYVEKYNLKQIGEYPTPWPCFHIAARNEMLKEDKLKDLLKVIQKAGDYFNKNHDKAIALIQKYYGLNQADIKEWIQGVTWATESNNDEAVIKKVKTALQRVNLIKS